YDYRFELGKSAELRTGRDVVLISTGLMTMRALQAAARLEADHVDVAVLHVPTIKPLDREAILRVARTDRLVVTLENHTVIGGVSEAGASTPPRRPPPPARPLRPLDRRDRQKVKGRAWRTPRLGRPRSAHRLTRPPITAD